VPRTEKKAVSSEKPAPPEDKYVENLASIIDKLAATQEKLIDAQVFEG
jgi:hypothetical protein